MNLDRRYSAHGRDRLLARIYELEDENEQLRIRNGGALLWRSDDVATGVARYEVPILAGPFYVRPGESFEVRIRHVGPGVAYAFAPHAAEPCEPDAKLGRRCVTHGYPLSMMTLCCEAGR